MDEEDLVRLFELELKLSEIASDVSNFRYVVMTRIGLGSWQ